MKNGGLAWLNQQKWWFNQRNRRFDHEKCWFLPSEKLDFGARR